MSLISDALRNAEERRSRKRLTTEKKTIPSSLLSESGKYKYFNKRDKSVLEKRFFTLILIVMISGGVLLIILSSIITFKKFSAQNTSQTAFNHFGETSGTSMQDSPVYPHRNRLDHSPKKNIAELSSGNPSSQNTLALKNVRKSEKKNLPSVKKRDISAYKEVKKELIHTQTKTSYNKNSAGFITPQPPKKEGSAASNLVDEQSTHLSPLKTSYNTTQDSTHKDTALDIHASPVDKRDTTSFFKMEVVEEKKALLKDEDPLQTSRFSAADYNNFAIACFYKGELKEAIDYLKMAIQMDCDNFESYVNLGIVFKKQKNYGYALNAYNKAIMLEPNAPDTYYNLGILLNDMGNLQGAAIAFRQFLSLATDEYQEIKKKVEITLKKIESELPS